MGLTQFMQAVGGMDVTAGLFWLQFTEFLRQCQPFGPAFFTHQAEHHQLDHIGAAFDERVEDFSRRPVAGGDETDEGSAALCESVCEAGHGGRAYHSFPANAPAFSPIR